MRSRIQRRLTAAVASLACMPSIAQAGNGQANLLKNADFERASAGRLDAWSPYGGGYTVEPGGGRGGSQGVKCVCPAPESITGLSQVIRLQSPTREPIVVSGWSRAESDAYGGEYSVYLDVIYADGTPLWGQQARFDRGPHDWQHATCIVRPAKPVKEIRVYVLYRRTTGTVWFDDVRVKVGAFEILPVSIINAWPRRDNGLTVRVEATHPADWTATVLGADGRMRRTHRARGERLAWSWDGKDQAGAKQPPGTYTVRLTARKVGAAETAALERRVATMPRRPAGFDGDYTVWVEDSMTKVMPAAVPPEHPRTTMALSLARNEVEGAQVVLYSRPGKKLRDVVIEIDGPRTKQGEPLTGGTVTWRRVGYVRSQRSSGHPVTRPRPGWYPDPLLATSRFDALPAMAQPVWVNVRTSAQTPPGSYEGRIRIKPANAPASSVALTVTVWPFALPTATHVKTAFCIMDGFLRRTYGPITPELRRSALDVMLDHRLNPDDISRTEPPAIEDLQYATRRGMNAFNVVNLVPKPTKPVPWVCYAPLQAYMPDFTEKLARRLDAYMAEVKRRGLIDKAYFYGFDERGPEYYPVIKKLFAFVKRRYPGVRTLTTAGFTYKHDHWRTDGVDAYCPLSSVYQLDRSEMMRQAGKQVWWYTCCGPKFPYANFSSFDYPTVEARLIWWMTYKWRVDGFLFWHVNHWPAEAKPLDGSNTFVDWPLPCVADMSGDGVLTYPGVRGLLSSIRLENIRDGIEDVEYLHLLARSVGREGVERICDRICPAMTSFTRDPEALRAARREVARRLVVAVESAAGGATPGSP